MMAWYRRMKHNEEWMRRAGWLLSEPEIARNYRVELTMHFRSFFRLLPTAAIHITRASWFQVNRRLVSLRLLLHRTFHSPFDDTQRHESAAPPQKR